MPKARRSEPKVSGVREIEMNKLPPINVKDEREAMQRDAAARWLAKHDRKRKPKSKNHAGQRAKLSVTAVTDKFERAIMCDMKQRQCEQCGELFAAKRRDARYCSNTCRQRAHRAKDKRILERLLALVPMPKAENLPRGAGCHSPSSPCRSDWRH